MLECHPHRMLIRRKTVVCYRAAFLLITLLNVLSLNLWADIRPILLSGQIAPGADGSRFVGIGRARVNATGTMAFSDTLTGPGATSGIFRIQNGELLPILLQGQAAPDSPGRIVNLVSEPSINNAGEIAFRAILSALPAPTTEAIFLWSGQSLRKVVDTDSYAPGDTGQKFSSFGNVEIDDAGEIAFFAVLTPGAPASNGIFVASQGVVKAAVLTTTGSTGVQASNDFALNSTGEIAFALGTDGVYLYSNGSTKQVAKSGTAIPNSNFVLDTMAEVGINDAGDIVFINGTVSPQPRGPSTFVPNSVVLLKSGGFAKVAAKGELAPGVSGAVFDGDFIGPQIDGSGKVTFTVRIRTSSSSSFRAIIIKDAAGLSAIASEGQYIDGVGVASSVSTPTLGLNGKLVTFVSRMSPLLPVGLFAATFGQFTSLFPQVAVGSSSGGAWRTTLILANRSGAAASATVRFFDDNGIPMTVRSAGQDQTEFQVNIPALGVTRFQADSPGPLQTGWALVQADQDISGIAIFGFYNSSGDFVDEVGAPASVPFRSMSIFVEAGANASTGVALANPNPIPAEVTVILRDSNSTEIARTTVTVPPMGHLARYVTELFGAVASGDLEGKIDISSGQAVIALGLRQRALVFTSLPVIP